MFYLTVGLELWQTHKLKIVMATKEKSSSGQPMVIAHTTCILREGGASIYMEKTGASQ